MLGKGRERTVSAIRALSKLEAQKGGERYQNNAENFRRQVRLDFAFELVYRLPNERSWLRKRGLAFPNESPFTPCHPWFVFLN